MGKELSLNILELARKVKKLEEAGGGEAEDIEYDPTASHLEATNVQNAIDELSGEIAEMSAEEVSYDGTDSGLSSTNVQAAIDEVVNMIGTGGQKSYGTVVDITTATQAQPYTCPSDGVVNLQSGYASANYTALLKVGWTGFMAIAKGNESQANGALTVPVLKGDQLYIQSSGTNPVANYYPYVV